MNHNKSIVLKSFGLQAAHGHIEIILSQPASIPNVGQITVQPVRGELDQYGNTYGDGIEPSCLYRNGVMRPAGTFYHVQAFDKSGTLVEQRELVLE